MAAPADSEPAAEVTGVSGGESVEFSRRRFGIELEFVQLFADSSYLLFLAQQSYLAQPSFIAYLQYLYDTWSRPEYARYLLFPHCLTYLHKVIQDPEFCKHVVDPAVAADLKALQMEAWNRRAQP